MNEHNIIARLSPSRRLQIVRDVTQLFTAFFPNEDKYPAEKQSSLVLMRSEFDTILDEYVERWGFKKGEQLLTALRNYAYQYTDSFLKGQDTNEGKTKELAAIAEDIANTCIFSRNRPSNETVIRFCGANIVHEARAKLQVIISEQLEKETALTESVRR